MNISRHPSLPRHCRSIRQSLRQVIEVMQYFVLIHFKDDVEWQGPTLTVEDFKAELQSFKSLPKQDKVLDPLWAPFHLAVYRQIPTIWCCRNHHLCTRLFLALCIAAGLCPSDIVDAVILKSELKKLLEITETARNSSLQMIEATEPGSFCLFLDSLTPHNTGSVIYCDWPLDNEEIEAVNQIAEKLNILFVLPAK